MSGKIPYGAKQCMADVADSMKDIVGPKGAVSFVMNEPAAAPGDGAGAPAENSDKYVKIDRIRLHHAELGPDGMLARADEIIRLTEQLDHDQLCEREQRFLLDAIRTDADLSQHLEDAVTSLGIVLAADRSIREGRVIEME